MTTVELSGAASRSVSDERAQTRLAQAQREIARVADELTFARTSKRADRMDHVRRLDAVWAALADLTAAPGDLTAAPGDPRAAACIDCGTPNVSPMRSKGPKRCRRCAARGNGARARSATRGTGPASRFAAQMCAERERGDSYRVIAERYGCSCSRVQQLIARERALPAAAALALELDQTVRDGRDAAREER